jgi:hypothetical protein
MLMPLRKRPRSETCATVELSFSGPVRRHMSCNCKSLLQCSPFLRLGDSAPMGEVRNLRHDVIEEVGWRRWRFHLSFKVRPIVVVIRTLSAFSGWCVAEKQAAPPRPKVFPATSPSSHFCFPAFPAFNFRVSRLQISAIPHLTIQDQHLAIRSSSLSDTFVV